MLVPVSLGNPTANVFHSRKTVGFCVPDGLPDGLNLLKILPTIIHVHIVMFVVAFVSVSVLCG